MLWKLLKMYLLRQMPKPGFALLHPIKMRRARQVSGDLKSAYAPRLTALAAALLVGPIAYRLGKRSAEGTLLIPRHDSAALHQPSPSE